MMGSGGPPIYEDEDRFDSISNLGGTVSRRMSRQNPGRLFAHPRLIEDAAVAAEGGTFLDESEPRANGEERMRLWFFEPIRQLKQKCRQNGGFAVLSLSIPLYERYARIKLKQTWPDIDLEGRGATEKIATQLAQDMGSCDQCLYLEFWRCVRHGLMHTGMPFEESRDYARKDWELDNDYVRPIQWHDDSKQVIDIQPWKFADWVMALWEDNMDLADHDEAAPLGCISPKTP